MSAPAPRLAAIEHLRGLAAMAVVAAHAGQRVAPVLPEGAAAALAMGHAGVDLFFAISGFVVWRLIGRGGNGAAFLWRRLRRVAPPYWAASLAWIVLALLAGYGWALTTPAHVAASLLFWPQESPAFPGQSWPVLVPGWTLNLEMAFYGLAGLSLAWPGLPGGARRAGLAAMLAALVLAGLWFAPARAPLAAWTSPLMLEFLGGGLVAWARDRWPEAGAGAALALGLGALGLAGPVDPGDHAARALAHGAPMLLILAGLTGFERRLPRAAPLARLGLRLGAASYAIYLSHLLLMVPLSGLWARLPATAATGWGFVALVLPLCAALGLALRRAAAREGAA